jgi:hypothetical protein
MKQLTSKDNFRVIFPEIKGKEDCMAGFSKIQVVPIRLLCLCMLYSVASKTKLTAVGFGQQVHPILIIVTFLFRFFEGQNLQK